MFCNPGNIPVANLDGCNHEEADTKDFLHANDSALSGHSSFMMLTVDSDWVFLAPGAMDYISRLGLRELWIGFGHRANRYDRIDWVTDNWFTNSIKSAVRETRGDGRTRIVDEQTKIPSNWQEFMRDDANKIQLFPVLGNMLLRKQIPEVSYFLEYLLMHRIPRITLYMQ